MTAAHRNGREAWVTVDREPRRTNKNRLPPASLPVRSFHARGSQSRRTSMRVVQPHSELQLPPMATLAETSGALFRSSDIFSGFRASVGATPSSAMCKGLDETLKKAPSSFAGNQGQRRSQQIPPGEPSLQVRKGSQFWVQRCDCTAPGEIARADARC